MNRFTGYACVHPIPKTKFGVVNAAMNKLPSWSSPLTSHRCRVESFSCSKNLGTVEGQDRELHRLKLNEMAITNSDREYETHLNLARKLIIKIKDKTDRSIALKYVNLLTGLKSNDAVVKRNRNAFFKYFLQVLENQLNIEAKQTILCTCPVENEKNLTDPLKYLQKEGLGTGEKVTTHWSKDKRSYVSAKIIPGRGTLLYMAVSSDAECDWDVRAPKTNK